MIESSTDVHRSELAGALMEPDYWVTIPEGPFVMGSDETNRADGKPLAAAPMHTVEVESFRMSRRPVSVSEFARFVAETSYVTTAERAGRSWVWLGGEDTTTPDQDQLWAEVEGASWRNPRGPGSDVSSKADHPVTHVSRFDCLEYCAWSGTRLATEAEWEKAARGTDGRSYVWGDSAPTPTVCNHSMFVGDTTPIGSYPDASGPYGLADMAGNVWEWTSSGWHPYPFTPDQDARVIATRSGPVKLGVMRGGSFFNNCDPRGIAVWVRVYAHPNYSCYDMGFRVCAL